MNMKNNITLLLALLITTSFFSCNKSIQKSSKSESIEDVSQSSFDRIKPVLDMAIGCQSDVFEEDKGAQINYASGAKVIVPADAFVDKNGEPVTGKVKLEFAEINDAASVIASGLPMCIEQDGEIGYFESGGMFEINANQNGEPLRLAEGKRIEIQTMSDKPGDFNFYEFNEANGKWVEQNKTQLAATTQPNQPPVLLDTIANSRPPIKPTKATSEDFIFDLRVDNVDEYGMKNWEGIMWKFSEAEGKEQKSNHWLFDKKWKKIKIGSFNPKTASCLITAEYSEKEAQVDPKTGVKVFKKIKKEMTARVTPVLFGNGYKKALDQYYATIEQMKKNEYRMAQAAKLQSAQNAFLRSVSVQNLGVYNWGRIIKQPETLMLTATYQVEDIYENHELPVVYMIAGDRKEVITFYKDRRGNLAFNPTYQNTLMVIMPNKEIAMLKTNDISNDKINAARTSKKIDINLKPTGVFVESTDQLGEFIRKNS